MKLIIRYKEPIPEEMQLLYERAFKVAFGACEISWWNPKMVRVSNIEDSNVEVQEDD